MRAQKAELDPEALLHSILKSEGISAAAVRRAPAHAVT
jgi:hypothetical protein